jgi:ribonuclease R
MLEKALVLARHLNKHRQHRGSIDFDLPEPELLFNIQNEPIDIRPKVGHFGHQIIEEFMIAANEAVADSLESSNLPCLFRIHPDPDQDKLQALFRLLEKTSMASSIPRQTDAPSLQQLLHQVEDTDLEFLVNRLLLRTMMQACYSPDNQGHFGLASDCYCHFTSPIRRYADLCVHRSLKATLTQSPAPKQGQKQLHKLGLHLSNQERLAMAAERTIIKRLTIIILKDKIGQIYTGIIASLTDFGFWVELVEVLAEGLVRLSNLTDDYYLFSSENQRLTGKRTGKTFTLGQKVHVRIVNVSLARQEIDLELVENHPDSDN